MAAGSLASAPVVVAEILVLPKAGSAAPRARRTWGRSDI